MNKFFILTNSNAPTGMGIKCSTFLILLFLSGSVKAGCLSVPHTWGTFGIMDGSRDTVQALNHLRARKVRGKVATIVISLGIAAAFSLSNNSTPTTGDKIVVGLAGLAIVGELISIGKFRKKNFKKIIDDYSGGVPIPANIRVLLEEKDFKSKTKSD